MLPSTALDAFRTLHVLANGEKKEADERMQLASEAAVMLRPTDDVNLIRSATKLRDWPPTVHVTMALREFCAEILREIRESDRRSINSYSRNV